MRIVSKLSLELRTLPQSNSSHDRDELSNQRARYTPVDLLGSLAQRESPYLLRSVRVPDSSSKPDSNVTDEYNPLPVITTDEDIFVKEDNHTVEWKLAFCYSPQTSYQPSPNPQGPAGILVRSRLYPFIVIQGVSSLCLSGADCSEHSECDLFSKKSRNVVIIMGLCLLLVVYWELTGAEGWVGERALPSTVNSINQTGPEYSHLEHCRMMKNPFDQPPCGPSGSPSPSWPGRGKRLYLGGTPSGLLFFSTLLGDEVAVVSKNFFSPKAEKAPD